MFTSKLSHYHLFSKNLKYSRRNTHKECKHERKTKLSHRSEISNDSLLLMIP